MADDVSDFEIKSNKILEILKGKTYSESKDLLKNLLETIKLNSILN
jgi:hypothetical protein